MKIEILKQTDKTITCRFYMKDKILHGRIWKTKHFRLWLAIKKQAKFNNIIYLDDFARYTDNIIDTMHPSVFNGHDKLAYMILKEPDIIPEKGKYYKRRGREKEVNKTSEIPDLSCLKSLNGRRLK